MTLGIEAIWRGPISGGRQRLGLGTSGPVLAASTL